MKTKKIWALFLSVILAVCLAGCKKSEEPQEAVSQNPPQEQATATPVPTKEPVQDAAEPAPVSVDFEDGQFGFVMVYTKPANADASELAIADYNGSKALKVTNMNGRVPYVAIDISSLAGDRIASVRSITMDLAIENPDGKFYACSGKVTAFVGEDRHESKGDWSVYMEKKNPNTVKAVLQEGESFAAGFQNLIILSLETDNGVAAGAKSANFYIDNIRLLDKDGNTVAADSSVVFDEPAGFSEVDRANLIPVKNEVEIWSGDSGAAWSQGTGVQTVANGGTFDPALITEDSVITIYYQSEGDMWLVASSWVDGAPFGWQRVADGGASIKNPSGTIAQITYDQLKQYCNTDDFVTYLSQLQCESDMDWSVASVTIGQRSGIVELKNKVEIWSGDSGDAWSQGTGVQTIADGGPFDPALIQPGCVINIDYVSEGNVWLVAISGVDGAPFSWQRVADGGASAIDGDTCQITYDQLVKYCNTDDFVTYLSKLQVESDMPWQALSVSIGYPSGLVPVNKEVKIEGLAGDKGDAWSQGTGVQTLADGGTLDPALIQPGCVITVDYASDGMLWLVAISGVDGAPFGWQRVADGGAAADNGSRAQITYEQLVKYCNTEDFVTYLSKLQCESDAPWEVYRATIGYPAE